MYQVIDRENHFKPVKSGFQKASQAYAWAKKHLPEGACLPIGRLYTKQDKTHLHRYFVQGS